MSNNKPKKSALALIVILILAMVFRKYGFGLSSIILNISVAALCFIIIRWPVFFKNIYARIISAFFLVLCLAFLQYWLSAKFFHLDSWGDVPVNTLWMMAWMIFSILSFREIIENGITLVLWLYISLVLSTTIFFNPREFHEFYRYSMYEEYIRKKYPARMGVVADYFIDKYKDADTAAASAFFQEAVHAEEKGEYQEALVYYNRCIDENPDDKIAYHRRGFLKLTHLDINEDVAISALKDFDRCLRLDKGYTIAYFHRGITFGYLGNKTAAYINFKRVWQADSILGQDEFKKKYGVSKDTFSIPLHP